MRFNPFLLVLLIVFPAIAKAELPPALPKEVSDLLLKRDDAIAEIHLKTEYLLEELKIKYVKLNDFDAALEIEKLIKRPGMSVDPLVGTTWNFIGVNGRSVWAVFEFLPAGKMKNHGKKCPGIWKRLTKDVILYNYNPGGDYIVFRMKEDGSMSGHRAGDGRARYLKKVK